MGDHILESRVWLARPRDDVFAFVADPANASRLTPPGYRLRAVTGPSAVMAAGAVIEFRLRLWGIPLVWRSFVREYDPPFRFVEVQVVGPYARWEHRHRFLEERDGTVVEDRVTYRLPLGPLGRAAHALLIRRQLLAVWRYRDRRLTERLGSISLRAG